LDSLESQVDQEVSINAATSAPPRAAPARPAAVAPPKPPAAVMESTPDPPVNKMRRRIVWASVAGFLTTCFLMFLRFFLPRSILEPSSVFRVGFPSDYALGVDILLLLQYRM